MVNLQPVSGKLTATEDCSGISIKLSPLRAMLHASTEDLEVFISGIPGVSNSTDSHWPFPGQNVFALPENHN